MTYSSVAMVNTTGAELIRDALLLVRAIEAGTVLESTELSDGLRTLNRMVKTLQRDYPLFSLRTLEIPLVRVYDTTNSTDVIGDKVGFNIPRPAGFVDGYCREVSDTLTQFNDNPIDIISRDEWNLLSDKYQTGSRPLKMFPEPRNQYWALHMWPMPDSTELRLSLSSFTQSVTNPLEYHKAGPTAEPSFVWVDGVRCNLGTLGNLGQYEYAYGDNDTIGSSHLYVRGPDVAPTTVLYVASDDASLLYDTAIFTYRAQIPIFTDPTQYIDFPPEMHELVLYNLAVRLAPMFGKDPNVNRVAEMAAYLLGTMRNADAEVGSFQFSPGGR